MNNIISSLKVTGTFYLTFKKDGTISGSCPIHCELDEIKQPESFQKDLSDTSVIISQHYRLTVTRKPSLFSFRNTIADGKGSVASSTFIGGVDSFSGGNTIARNGGTATSVTCLGVSPDMLIKLGLVSKPTNTKESDEKPIEKEYKTEWTFPEHKLNFAEIDTSGSVSVTMKDTAFVRHCKVNVEGSGRVELDSLITFEGNINGSGSIETQLVLQKVTTNVKGDGKISGLMDGSCAINGMKRADKVVVVGWVTTKYGDKTTVLKEHF